MEPRAPRSPLNRMQPAGGFPSWVWLIAVLLFGGMSESARAQKQSVGSVELEITENTQQRAVGRRVDPRLAGVELENFWNPDEPGKSAGVLTTTVDPRSKAYAYGLRAGDVIVGANRRTVRDIAELRDAILLEKRQIVLRVYRNGRFGDVVVR